MKTYYLQLTCRQWAWGPSAHWRLYHSLKNFSKKWVSAISTVTSENEDKSNTRHHSKARQLVSKGRRYSTTRIRKSSSENTSHFHGENLTDKDVNDLLWKNETTLEINSNKVSRCETNQLSSNQPNEDQIFVSKSYQNEGLLFGVLDGHGGSLFGEHTKTRLPYYLHTSLSDKNIVLYNNLKPTMLAENLLEPNNNNLLIENVYWEQHLDTYMNDLMKDFNFNNDSVHVLSYVSDPLRQLFGKSVIGEYEKISNVEISSAIKDAFMRLDADMISELKHMAEKNELNLQNIGTALSGCCALIAYINQDELFVANSGDCRAVLGSRNNGFWSAIQLTNDHTAASNPDEVQRILAQHPGDEAKYCIQYGRLLGRLAPLRAFGDIQFKLYPDELHEIFKILPRFSPMQHLRTPPYLTAEPEVFHYKIEKNDRFIVLASDGLWDMLSNEEVVELVAAYMEGKRMDKLKERAHMFGVPGCDDILSNPNAFADSEKENVASFLIRFALGGFDRQNLSTMLTLPPSEVRFYRDDISISVIFLDNNVDDSFSDPILI